MPSEGPYKYTYDTASGFKSGQDDDSQPDLYIKDGVTYNRKTGKPHAGDDQVRKQIFDAAGGFLKLLKGE